MPSRDRRPAGDRGSGTVLLLGVVAVGLAALLLIGMLVSAQVCRGRAQSAADLAALAGAAALRAGEPACDVAAQAVRRHDLTLVTCADEGAGVVRVEASCDAPAGRAAAVARAGPASQR